MRVAVVGSGIAGASAGYELTGAGADVVLVDSLVPGRATSAGAGIICPWSSRVDDEDWYRLAVAGAEHYQELLAALAADEETEFGYRRVGSLRLVDDAEATEALRPVAERAAKSPMAGEVELVSARRARELFPSSHTTRPTRRLSRGMVRFVHPVGVSDADADAEELIHGIYTDGLAALLKTVRA